MNECKIENTLGKSDLLRILKLLSALECAGMMRSPKLPAYLYDEIHCCVEMLHREILQ